MIQIWRRISVREQRLLQLSGAFLLAVVAFSLIWQPTRQRLETVERQYQQQAGLAAQASAHYQRAGERDTQRSANEEAIGHLRRALALVGTLPETCLTTASMIDNLLSSSTICSCVIPMIPSPHT